MVRTTKRTSLSDFAEVCDAECRSIRKCILHANYTANKIIVSIVLSIVLPMQIQTLLYVAQQNIICDRTKREDFDDTTKTVLSHSESDPKINKVKLLHSQN